MEGDISEENILKFVQDWESGKLGAHYKSDPIPESQEGDVVVIVGKNFKDIVLDESKDVLVEFYAPWCGHCKKLAPIFDELATSLKHNKNLIIAKCDSTANEVDGVHIKGFPTIKFWPGKKKDSPIDFDGDRTVEGFSKWLSSHVTIPISLERKDDL